MTQYCTQRSEELLVAWRQAHHAEIELMNAEIEHRFVCQVSAAQRRDRGEAVAARKDLAIEPTRLALHEAQRRRGVFLAELEFAQAAWDAVRRRHHDDTAWDAVRHEHHADQM